MGYTKVIFNKELAERLQLGVNIIGDAVGATLGYNGRNVLVPEIDPTKLGRHKITKDGVTVAQSIATLEDPIANAAAQMIKDVASAAHKLAGDGTTTATVLAQAIFNKGLEFLKQNPKANPIELNNGIQHAVVEVVKFLKENAVQINNDEAKLIQVATIAANNDEKIGKLVGEVMAELGSDGKVNVERPPYTTVTEYKPTLGFNIFGGYINEWLINNKQDKLCQFQSPLILLSEDKLNLFVKEVLPAMEKAEKLKRPLLIICESVEGEALNTISTNASRGWPVCAIRIPALASKKLDLLRDIQATVGGSIFSQSAGKMLEFIEEADFGKCESCQVSADNTQLFGGLGKPEDIQLRVSQLTSQLETAQTDGEIKWLKYRLTTLTAKRGTIYVGGNSDLEKKELADRIDDAIEACASAMKEGILPGGGIALIKSNVSFEKFTGDFSNGMFLLSECKNAPFLKIMLNSALDSTMLDKAQQEIEFSHGYNSKTGEWEDLIKSGIIDPVKVTRVALENAASISGQLLTATCGVYYEK